MHGVSGYGTGKDWMGKMAQVHSIRVVQTSGLLLEQMAGLELMNVLLQSSSETKWCETRDCDR